MNKRLILTFILLVLFVSWSSTTDQKRIVRAEDSIPGYELISHRGFEDQFPENTVYSGKKALRYGTPVEFDVQFTKDGQMILMHDESVDRTTNGTGLVKDLNASYIKGLDAGIKYSKKYKGIGVPTFIEYLDAIKGMEYIYPELKSYRNEDDIRRFTKLLIDKDFEYRSTILSFGYLKTLPIIRSLSKDIKVGALAGSQDDFEVYFDMAKKDRNSVMVISKTIASAENLKRCQRENIDVIVWTVRSEKETRELARIGYTKFISSRFFKMN